MKIVQEKPMNINDTLLAYFECDANIRNASEKEAICKFIKAPIRIKTKFVKPLIQKLMEPHSKGALFTHIDELRKIEESTKELTEKRDHVIHAVNTYLLGRYINDICCDIKVDEFEWKLAALFHDIGYPIEITAFYDTPSPSNPQQIIERYFKILSKNGVLEISYPIDINLVLEKFKNLAYKKDALEYIQEGINQWDTNINVREKYETMISTNEICHGMISALTILHWINSMYLRHNPNRSESYIPAENSDWNLKYFKNNVISACSAIFLHDLDDDVFVKIDKKKAPLPYLLKLCDELQNWDRPKSGVAKEDSDNYGISIKNNGKMCFYVKDEAKMNKIKGNIECLNDDSINICPFTKEGAIK